MEGTYFWDAFIDDTEREAMIQRFHDASPEFPAAEYENAFTDAQGKDRVIAWHTAPLADESGNVVRIIAGGIDITDRKRREVDLQRQRDFATTVANAIPSFIVITDHDANVVPLGANRAFCDAYGPEPRGAGRPLVPRARRARRRVHRAHGDRRRRERRPSGRARVTVDHPGRA